MPAGINPQYYYIIFGWIITIIALILFIPKNKICVAAVAFQFKQTITWLLGLTVVQLGLIEYPVRSLPKATMSSFDFEFFIYPAICAIFNVHYPQGKSKPVKVLYYAGYCSGITVVEVLAEHYTDVITYVHWAWYVTWITLCITFFLCRVCVVWFFKRLNKDGGI
jgi:hypothetical protein